MPGAKILLADNNGEVRRAWGTMLADAGYEVVLAANVAEARDALGKSHIDLAILDLRFGDEMVHDRTGLLLAQDENFLSVPKILFSAYSPSYDEIREFSQLPFAFDFISKTEGPERLLVSVSKTLNIVRMSKHQQSADKPERSITGRDVFLVHGHDREAIHEVARFLEKLDLVPVILSETSNAGAMTIIELIESWSKACFTIVIMTPDDSCSSIEQPKRKIYRARQNVIFEMGYFIGKLGREKVCVLRKEAVEMLSDIHGILYIPMDPAGGWKLPLARHLKAAGLKVDLNTL
jgi:predicted nucleotide-binding protein